MSRIETLTPEQEKRIPEIVDRWVSFAVGGDTKIDWDKAKNGLTYLYGLSKKKCPLIFYADSPLASQITAEVVINLFKDGKLRDNLRNNLGSNLGNNLGNNLGSNLRNNLWHNLGNNLMNNLGNNLGNNLWNNLRDNLGNNLWNNLGNNLGNNLWNNLRDNLGNNLMNNLGNNLGNNLMNNLGNNLGNNLMNNLGNNLRDKNIWRDFSWLDLNDAGWVAFYEFGEEIGVKYPKEISDGLKLYAEIPRAGVMFSILLDGTAVLCRRPELVKRDSRNRLHCADGPAVRWKDGVCNWYWHGTAVPPKLIMDSDNVTREEILAEKNSEVSRAYAEKLGWEKYFKLTDVKKVDAWLDPRTGLHYELYDFQQRLGDRQPKLLKMESPEINDGTKPCYIEPVDPALKTAQAARKWQIPRDDGQWPSVEECNANPALEFAWEA